MRHDNQKAKSNHGWLDYNALNRKTWWKVCHTTPLGDTVETTHEDAGGFHVEHVELFTRKPS